jgi:uncharacterized protein (TIGR00251 family)
MAAIDRKKKTALGGAAITVRVTPRAGKTKITGILEDGTIKIAVAGPPVDGKANQALVVYLAGLTGLKPANIDIVAGQTGHNKLITFTGINSLDLQEILLAAAKKE